MLVRTRELLRNQKQSHISIRFIDIQPRWKIWYRQNSIRFGFGVWFKFVIFSSYYVSTSAIMKTRYDAFQATCDPTKSRTYCFWKIWIHPKFFRKCALVSFFFDCLWIHYSIITSYQVYQIWRSFWYMHRWCSKTYHIVGWPRCRRQNICAISYT